MCRFKLSPTHHRIGSDKYHHQNITEILLKWCKTTNKIIAQEDAVLPFKGGQGTYNVHCCLPLLLPNLWLLPLIQIWINQR